MLRSKADGVLGSTPLHHIILRTRPEVNVQSLCSATKDEGVPCQARPPPKDNTTHVPAGAASPTSHPRISLSRLEPCHGMAHIAFSVVLSLSWPSCVAISWLLLSGLNKLGPSLSSRRISHSHYHIPRRRPVGWRCRSPWLRSRLYKDQTWLPFPQRNLPPEPLSQRRASEGVNGKRRKPAQLNAIR